MGKYYCTLGRIYVKQNISKQVCLKWSKNSRRVYRVGSSETPGRICNFYPCFQKGYPELKLQHNCFIRISGFLPITFTLPQNMKGRELQKSQFLNCLVNWEIFESIFKASIQKCQFSISSMN